MVLPGDIVIATVELGKNTPIEEGQRFAIREGKRTVGAGFITKVNQFESLLFRLNVVLARLEVNT